MMVSMIMKGASLSRGHGRAGRRHTDLGEDLSLRRGNGGRCGAAVGVLGVAIHVVGGAASELGVLDDGGDGGLDGDLRSGILQNLDGGLALLGELGLAVDRAGRGEGDLHLNVVDNAQNLVDGQNHVCWIGRLIGEGGPEVGVGAYGWGNQGQEGPSGSARTKGILAVATKKRTAMTDLSRGGFSIQEVASLGKRKRGERKKRKMMTTM